MMGLGVLTEREQEIRQLMPSITGRDLPLEPQCRHAEKPRFNLSAEALNPKMLCVLPVKTSFYEQHWRRLRKTAYCRHYRR